MLGYFTPDSPAGTAQALALAAIFCERLRAKGFLRPLFFMPSIIPAAAIFFYMDGFADLNAGWLNRLIAQPLDAAGPRPALSRCC